MKLLKKIAAVVLTGVFALTALTGCSSANSTNATLAAQTALVNTFLKGHGTTLSVTASDELTQDAATYAEILKKYNAISEGTSQDDSKLQYNYGVHEKRDIYEYTTLDSYKKVVRMLGQYENHDGDYENQTSQEQRAKYLAWDLEGLGDYDEHGNLIKSYTPVSIGIVSVSDINEPVWGEKYEHFDEDGESQGTYSDMVATRKFSGWVVVISYK